MKRRGRNAEEQALFDYQDAGSKFTEGGAAEYKKGNDFKYNDLGELDRAGPSGYADIKTDPAYKQHEMEALRQLENQSQDGYTARDRADLARVEQNASRANKGRQGAIDQQVQARGLGGSGLEFALKQQAAQDSAEQEAMAGLEKNAQMQDRKQSAVSRLGELSGQMQSRDFSQQAQNAQAQDSINRFNTQNSNQRQIQNNQGQNQANQTNNQRDNQVADNNVNAQYGFRKDTLGVAQDNATKAYDYSADMYNREQARKAAKAAKKGGMMKAVGTVAGAALGTYFAPVGGGVAGAAAGGALGGAIGDGVGGMAHGGRVPGPEIVKGDSSHNDVVSALLSGGEIVIPKSHASDPMKAAKFVAEQNGQDLDPVGLLLEAMQHMHNKGKK